MMMVTEPGAITVGNGDFEIAVATWNFGLEYKNRATKPITLEQIAQRIRQGLGVSHIDLFDTHYHPVKDLLELSPERGTEDSYLDHAAWMRDMLANLGMSVLGISAINEFSVVGERRNTRERLRRWLQIAPVLGARFIRLSTEKWWLVPDYEAGPFDGKRMREDLQPVLDAWTDWDGCLVLENHPLDVPAGHAGDHYVAEWLKAIEGDSRLSLCVDDGHIADSDLDEWRSRLRQVLPHARYIHMKCGDKAFGHSPAPSWQERVELIRESFPTRPIPVNLEYSGTGDPTASLEEAILAL